MKQSATLLLAKKFIAHTLKQKVFWALWLLFALLLVYAGIAGYRQLTIQNNIAEQFQAAARKSWEANPDKHPHRMAHFGSFALRAKHPLGLFDFGMNNYAGNAVFLEAHKQNSVIYSEASFSTGLLRMGELHIAMLLQVILPLVLIFLGYGSIAADRENGALKIIISQGISARGLLMGRAIGLWLTGLLFLLPAMLLGLVLGNLHHPAHSTIELPQRFLLLTLLYLVFLWVMAVFIVFISSKAKTPAASLLSLLSLWLLLAVLLPKTIHVLASALYPSPSKLSFETAIEKDIVQQGDSHNPNDPFFKNIKDSVLKKYGADSASQLPVNLGGIIGKAGEKLSSETYAAHQKKLTALHRKQIGLAKWFAWADPFIMVKNNSMALAASDFETYTSFQEQAEAYRYKLAQQMNDLQIALVANTAPKEGSHLLHIDKKHWNELEDFQYKFMSTSTVIKNERITLLAMLSWLVLSFGALFHGARSFKIIK